MDIYDKAEKIASKKDFIEFLQILKESYSLNKDEWHNNDLPSYLEGLHGYCYDTVQNDKLSWAQIAQMLLAARVYE